MTQLTLDAATTAKLMEVGEMIELRDEAGRVVGHFLPGPPRDENGQIIVPISDEELDRRSREEGGRPLKDILADLAQR